MRFSSAAEHTILSSVPNALSARNAVDRSITVDFPTTAPSLAGRPNPFRLFRLARYLRSFDLVLSYNWGAMEAVMARRLFGGPPLIHHEDGFNEDEAERLNPTRNRYRRFALGAAHRLVVPSRRLETIALKDWKQPRAKVERIANGIDIARFNRESNGCAISGLTKEPSEIVIGTLAGLRAVKNLPRLIRAFAAMQNRNAKLVIVGEGPESERIAAEARRCGVANRLLMPGFMADPSEAVRCFDIFALSSDSEQFPISVVEAMAAGIPIVSTAVGDIAHMVSDDNRPLIVDRDDEAAFAAALDTLAERTDLRRSIGRANREKAAFDYDEAKMIARYAGLYGEAIGNADAFISALR